MVLHFGAVYYFNKDVKDLSLAECAYMAAINHSPNAYNPFKEDEKKEKRIENGHKRAKTVLGKMKELGSINQEEYDSAIAQINTGLVFSNGETGATTLVSYQTEAALDQIINQMVEEKGLSKDIAEIKLYSGGYHIYTTQNTQIQGRLEQELEKDKYLKTSPSKTQTTMASMVIIEPKTGNVVAASAGIGADKTHTYLGYFNYTTDLKKQTGSSIKPLAVIAPSLETGKITAATTFFDGESKFPGTKKNIHNEGAYSNANMTMRTAIAMSQNVPNYKALSIIGVKPSVEFCQKIGLKEIKGDEGLSLALGGLTTGVSTMQMAAAYGMVANDGVYIEPVFYTKILDKDGNTFMEPKSVEDRSTRVMTESNAYIVKSLMKGVVESPPGTGKYCAIPGIDVAAKTGTTDSHYDRWLCGFTNYYAGACWFGYGDKSETVTGFAVNPAGQIWSSVMKDIHSGLAPSTFAKPSNIVSAAVCLDTGMVASDKCSNVYTEEFVSGTVPAVCNKHQAVKICNDTGLLANEFCQNCSEKYFRVLSNEEVNGSWTVLNFGAEYTVPTEICTHTANDFTYED